MHSIRALHRRLLEAREAGLGFELDGLASSDLRQAMTCS
jgi:hypothetical protein